MYPIRFIGTDLTPLMEACLHHDLCQVQKLVQEKHVPVNFQSTNGWTALTIAILFNHRKIIRFLVTVGASTDITDESNNLPIDYAHSRHTHDISAMIQRTITRRDKILTNYLLPDLAQLVRSYC